MSKVTGWPRAHLGVTSLSTWPRPQTPSSCGEGWVLSLPALQHRPGLTGADGQSVPAGWTDPARAAGPCGHSPGCEDMNEHKHELLCTSGADTYDRNDLQNDLVMITRRPTLPRVTQPGAGRGQVQAQDNWLEAPSLDHGGGRGREKVVRPGHRSLAVWHSEVISRGLRGPRATYRFST